MDFFASMTLNEYKIFPDFHVNGVKQGPTIVQSQKIFPCFLMQKVANIAIGILASLYLYSSTPFVASISIGSTFALIGFSIALLTIYSAIFSHYPLLAISSGTEKINPAK